MYKYDHHCSYILNCVGANNIHIFLTFLIMTFFFLVLRLVFNFLSSIDHICWVTPHDDDYTFVASPFSIFGADPSCHYDYNLLGVVGKWIKESVDHTGWFIVVLEIFNWLHILLNLAVIVLIAILLKITMSNVLQGTTTYERHLRKMAKKTDKKDTTLNRELRENFLDDTQE